MHTFPQLGCKAHKLAHTLAIRWRQRERAELFSGERPINDYTHKQHQKCPKNVNVNLECGQQFDF